jgi:hypothetical protein
MRLTHLARVKMLRIRSQAVTAMIVCSALLLGAAQAPSQAGNQPPTPAQYAATAFGQAGAAAGKSFSLQISLQDVTSDGDMDELMGTLKHKGMDALVSAMDGMKEIGRVAPTGSIGTAMRVVRIHPGKNGGQHIVLVTNRPIAFAELYNVTRSSEYPFAIVTLDVDKDGKGTGSFAPVCKIRFNKKHELEIEHYGLKPFRLANVFRQK